MPKALPSSLVVHQETQQQMSLAHHMLGRLDEAAARLPDRTVLVSPIRYQEIQSMLALRGETVASREIAYADLPGGPPGLEPEDRIARYIQSLEEAIRSVAKTSVGRALLRAATGFAQLSDLAGDEEPP